MCGVTMNKVPYLQVVLLVLSLCFLVVGTREFSQLATEVAAANSDPQSIVPACTLSNRIILGAAGCIMTVTVATLNK